jgi:hypothetical protein
MNPNTPAHRAKLNTHRPLLLSGSQKGLITKALNQHAETPNRGRLFVKLRDAIAKSESREQAKHIARQIIAEMEAAGSVVAW